MTYLYFENEPRLRDGMDRTAQYTIEEIQAMEKCGMVYNACGQYITERTPLQISLVVDECVKIQKTAGTAGRVRA